MNKDSLRISSIGFVIAVIGFAVAFQFVEPSPPKSITIATGSQSGAYFKFAGDYQKILAQEGIQLKILNTKGSVENIQLLNAGKVDVAFVQGGVGNAQQDPNLVSLGSLCFEPLWVFVQKNLNVKRLNDLNGLKISAGNVGSGTWAVAQQLLAKNGINPSDKTILHLSSAKATQALSSKAIDAAFFVTSPASPLMAEMLKNETIQLLSFERAGAYTNQLRYLSAVTLNQGVINLGRNIPEKNITLLAPAATLVTHPDLHPALQNLLIQATQKTHANGSILAEPGLFPSAKYVDYPLSADAERYLKNGPPFLQRYLPFWGAVLFDRLKVMLVPLLTLLIPLIKIFPPTYRWRVRSRIYRWYEALSDIERRAKNASSDDHAKLVGELATIENEVKRLKVPLSYNDEVYNLRLHINLIQRTL